MGDGDDEIVFAMNEVKCFDCKKSIEGKPWITLSCDKGEFFIYGCSYSCSKHLHRYMGGSYWEKIVNKEDFDMPRPVTTCRVKKDITNNQDLQETIQDIEEEEEEKRIQMIEDYYNESSDEFISDDY